MNADKRFEIIRTSNDWRERARAVMELRREGRRLPSISEATGLSIKELCEFSRLARAVELEDAEILAIPSVRDALQAVHVKYGRLTGTPVPERLLPRRRDTTILGPVAWNRIDRVGVVLGYNVGFSMIPPKLRYNVAVVWGIRGELPDTVHSFPARLVWQWTVKEVQPSALPWTNDFTDAVVFAQCPFQTIISDPLPTSVVRAEKREDGFLPREVVEFSLKGAFRFCSSPLRVLCLGSVRPVDVLESGGEPAWIGPCRYDDIWKREIEEVLGKKGVKVIW